MDIIEEFVDATSALPVPERFRRWAALGLVSSVMSKRCWTSIGAGMKLYPNLFIVMVGTPGVGKSKAMEYGKILMRRFPSIHLSPDKATFAELVSDIADTFPDDTRTHEFEYTYCIWVGEAANFMPIPDIDEMQSLASLWDCPPTWEKHLKGNRAVKKFKKKDGTEGETTTPQDDIYDPYVTLVFGAQPDWLSLLFNQSMVGLGLPARVLFIYEDRPKPLELFCDDNNIDTRMNAIQQELKVVKGFAGYIPFDKEARATLVAWSEAGRPTAKGEPYIPSTATAHYGVRREMHISKLALVVAAARHPRDPVIHLGDLQTAMAILFDAEPGMKTALGFVGNNRYKSSEDAVVNWIVKEFEATKRAIPERKILEALRSATGNTFNVGMTIDALLGCGMLITTGGDAKAPTRLFKPGPAAYEH